MEIILGRLSYNRRFSGNDLSQRVIRPAGRIDDFSYSDLYMYEKDKLLEQPFSLLYFINKDWLYGNRNKVFNYSFDNSSEFQEFVEQMGFSNMDKIKFLKKERNHLLTSLDISINEVYKIILLGNYKGYFEDCKYMTAKFEPHPVRHRFMQFENGKKGAEFILK